MRDFQEFRDIINPKFYDELGKLIEESSASIEFPITKENAGRFLSMMAGINMHATLNILNGYHDWLQSQEQEKEKGQSPSSSSHPVV